MFVLAKQFVSRGVISKSGGRTRKVGASIKKVQGYVQFHVHKHGMPPTFTPCYFLEGECACYCEKAALILSVCAH